MEFGGVPDVDKVNFTLPDDHPDTRQMLRSAQSGELEVYVGCAKWGKADLQRFYPAGTKDELSYYAKQFNAIELNTLYYHFPQPNQVAIWREKTPEGFRFFPKVTRHITHQRNLVDPSELVDRYCEGIQPFGDRLGTIFLQYHEQFSPEGLERLETTLSCFPAGLSLATEVRHAKWFSDQRSAESYYGLLVEKGVSAVLVDTPGRRDLLHMRLTTPAAFIRYVGANHPTDYTRLDDWVDRIAQWRQQGLTRLYFFVHQKVEEECPSLAAHFIRKLNEKLTIDHPIPYIPPGDQGQLTIF